ncbi:MAG TPA: hypothetical protein VGG24_03690 [Paraburkholderia sp.]
MLTTALMQDVALYNLAVTGPRHALTVTDIACRTALGGRGVAHLTIAKDVQAFRLADDKPSIENHGIRTSTVWSTASASPSGTDLRAAADLINAGNRVAIIAGQGALGATAELAQLAARLNPPLPRRCSAARSCPTIPRIRPAASVTWARCPPSRRCIVATRS